MKRSFAQLALGSARDSKDPLAPLVPDSAGAAVQISRVFDFQSYFDNTQLEQALLRQAPNNPIVDAREEQITGYAMGLFPSSQTPVAVSFRLNGQQGSSSALILTPGQIIRPHGLFGDRRSGSFSGFQWGLPFGWLGGGLATLVVFQTPDAHARWIGEAPEVIFHRQRMQIHTPAGALPAAAPLNWPMRFAWPNAIFGSTDGDLPQEGEASIALTPTRVLMRLRMSALAAASDMRVIFQGTNDFDLDEDGDVIATPVSFVDMTWGSYTAAAGAGDLTPQYPVQFAPDVMSRLAADDGGVQLIDLSGGSLDGEYVDVVRYGRLG